MENNDKMKANKKLKFLMMDLKSYYDSPAYQLGLLVAYACTHEVVKENIDFEFTEHPRSQDAEIIVAEMLAKKPDLIAFSNYAWNHKKICAILDCMTAMEGPLPKILIGGSNSAGSFGDKMLRQYPIVSALVEGEGEPAFKDICWNMVTMPAEDPFANARNCVIRGPGDIILRPNIGNRIQHLDEVPSPYLEGILPLHPAPLFYETNRGCPYRCTFCYWGNGNSKVYRMSHERITAEMEYFAKNKVKALFLADANFGIFPGDADIARLICEVNARYGYPIRFVGVNWAKNSSDRILEIASIFREAKIGTATTLAIQSVSAKAEEISKRYAMPPSRFINLVKNAELRDIDTYTDLIWGLPGESVEEFITGLEAVICTGVPSLMTHQLSLLPGTELYESREELQIKLLAEEKKESDFSAAERSDYFEYIVISHLDMTYEDMKKGARYLGAAHIFHNHDLGKVVNFYLARYGLGVKEVYTFFDQLMLSTEVYFEGVNQDIFIALRDAILRFAEGTGNDETIFYRELSEIIWYKIDEHDQQAPRGKEMRDFSQAFYQLFCKEFDICQSPEEQLWLSAVVDYNWVISPKPAWRLREPLELPLDVDTIWQDIQTEIFKNALSEKEAKALKKANRVVEADNWAQLPFTVKGDIQKLLSEKYLEDKQKTTAYQITNPWKIPPSKKNIDWLIKVRSRHCQVKQVGVENLTAS